MPIEPKLSGRLKALLALHGMCASIIAFLALWDSAFGGFFRSLFLGPSVLLPILFIACFVLFRRRKKGVFSFLSAIVLLELNSLAFYLFGILDESGTDYTLCYPTLSQGMIAIGRTDGSSSFFITLLKQEPAYVFIYIVLPVTLFAATLFVSLLSLKPINTHLENKE